MSGANYVAKALAFKTHTGLLLALETEDGEHVVTLTGDRVKELLRTPVRAAAKKFYDAQVKDYKAREAAEA